MKQKISIIALFLSTGSVFSVGTAEAANQNFYVGASAGYSSINTPGSNAFNVGSTTTDTLITQTSATDDVGGFGGGLFAGYNFNKNLAVELGYTSYADSSYSSDQSQYSSLGGGNWAYNSSNSASLKYSAYSIDLFLKGTVPIIAQFSAFAKAGLSYVNQEVTYTNNADGTPPININNNNFATPKIGTNTYTAIRPSGAIGLSYQASEHLSTSIFAQGFLGKGDISTDSSAIASAYILGASISYDFL